MYGLVLLHTVLRLRAMGVSGRSSNDGCFDEGFLVVGCRHLFGTPGRWLKGCLFEGRSRKGDVENTLSAILYADFTYPFNIVYGGGSAKISPKTIHSRAM